MPEINLIILFPGVSRDPEVLLPDLWRGAATALWLAPPFQQSRYSVCREVYRLRGWRKSHEQANGWQLDWIKPKSANIDSPQKTVSRFCIGKVCVSWAWRPSSRKIQSAVSRVKILSIVHPWRQRGRRLQDKFELKDLNSPRCQGGNLTLTFLLQRFGLGMCWEVTGLHGR